MQRQMICLVLALVVAVFAAPVESVVSFQGKLIEAGAPVDGTRDIEFKLYDVVTGGTALWTESHVAVPVVGGLFNVELGGATTFASTAVDFSEQYWVGISVEGGAEITPRYKLTGTPYAMSDGDWIIDGTNMYSGVTGDVGIGTISPSAKLHIAGGSGDGVRISYSGDDGVHISSAVDDGVYIDSPGGDGVSIYHPVGDGVSVDHPDDDGVHISSAGDDGVYIREPSDDGVEIAGGNGTGRGLYIHDWSDIGDPDTGIVIREVGSHGIYIENPGNHGVYISSPDDDGVRIVYPDDDGVRISSPGEDGVYIDHPGDDGVEIAGGTETGRGIYIHDSSVGVGDPDTGIVIREVGSYGIYIDEPGDNGVQISSPGDDGVRISSPVDDGVSIYRPGGDGVDIEGGSITGRGLYIHDDILYGNPDTGIVVRGCDVAAYLAGDVFIDVNTIVVDGSANRVAMGTEIFLATTSRLQVNGFGTTWAINAYSGAGGIQGSGGLSNFDFYAAGAGVDYGTSSSIRWKRDIEPIDHALDKVLNMRGVYYNWDEEHGGLHGMGMIAEEVGKIIPEIVVFEKNGVDASGMDYGHLTPVLVEAIKDQQAQIERQQAQIDELRNEIETLKNSK